MPAIARMPSLHHAVLVPRLLKGESTSEGLSGTAIALIICIGIIPMCIVIGIVIWALFFYGQDRACCCGRRRRPSPATLPEQFPSSNSTVMTEEKRRSDYTINMPQRPINAARHGSRNSTQSTASTTSKRNSDIEQVVVQEPKPFV